MLTASRFLWHVAEKHLKFYKIFCKNYESTHFVIIEIQGSLTNFWEHIDGGSMICAKWSTDYSSINLTFINQSLDDRINKLILEEAIFTNKVLEGN